MAFMKACALVLVALQTSGAHRIKVAGSLNRAISKKTANDQGTPLIALAQHIVDMDQQHPSSFIQEDSSLNAHSLTAGAFAPADALASSLGDKAQGFAPLRGLLIRLGLAFLLVSICVTFIYMRAGSLLPRSDGGNSMWSRMNSEWDKAVDTIRMLYKKEAAPTAEASAAAATPQREDRADPEAPAVRFDIATPRAEMPTESAGVSPFSYPEVSTTESENPFAPEAEEPEAGNPFLPEEEATNPFAEETLATETFDIAEFTAPAATEEPEAEVADLVLETSPATEVETVDCAPPADAAETAEPEPEAEAPAPAKVKRISFAEPEAVSPGGTPAPAKAASTKKEYVEGDIVDIWSHTDGKWFTDGVIEEIRQNSSFAVDGKPLPPGSAKVVYNNGAKGKWLQPKVLMDRKSVKPSIKPRLFTGFLKTETYNADETWQVRYFELLDGKISWWKSAEDARASARPNRVLNLAGLQLKTTPESTQFSIRTSSSDGNVFNFDTGVEGCHTTVQQWVASLKQHASYANRMVKFRSAAKK